MQWWIIFIPTLVIIAAYYVRALNRYFYLESVILVRLGKVQKISGFDLHANLKRDGFQISGPGFYAVMDLLKETNSVKEWIEEKLMDGHIIKERWYCLQRGTTTESGRFMRAFKSLLPVPTR